MTVEEMLEEVVRQLRDYEHFVSLVSPHIEAILPVYQRGTMTERMHAGPMPGLFEGPA